MASLMNWGGNHPAPLDIWKCGCACVCSCSCYCFPGEDIGTCDHDAQVHLINTVAGQVANAVHIQIP